MNRLSSWVTLTVAGGVVEYFFDPDLGRRRRALARDRCKSAFNRLNAAADVTIRDVENRILGTFAELRRCMTDRNVPDDVLVDRVRAKLGRYVSHPGAIEVLSSEGTVILAGKILASEVQALVAAVESIPGVERVENDLDVHRAGENVAELQGGTPPVGEMPEWRQSNWSPAMRLVAGASGGLLVLNCVKGRTPLGLLLAAIGAGLVLRALAKPANGRNQQRSLKPRGAARHPENYGTQAKIEEHETNEAEIDEAVDSTFPASDPPSYMSGAVTRSRPPGPGEGGMRSPSAQPDNRSLMDL